MAQYINKDDLIAEIERIKKEECPIDTYEGRIKLFYFERFLSFLDTLEVKESDLDKEIIHKAELQDQKDIKNAFNAGYELGRIAGSKVQKGE